MTSRMVRFLSARHIRPRFSLLLQRVVGCVVDRLAPFVAGVFAGALEGEMAESGWQNRPDLDSVYLPAFEIDRLDLAFVDFVFRAA